MRSIAFSIAQSEHDKDCLCYRATVSGETYIGTLRISSESDIARFLGCVAHILKQSKIFDSDNKVAPICVSEKNETVTQV